MIDAGRPLTAMFHTLGCKLNFAETSTIGGLMEERGILRTPQGEQPDIIVVNTCSVTAMADKKSRHLIRTLHKRYPEAAIVVTGCYVQLRPEEAAQLEGVDIVLGSNDKLRIAEYLDRWLNERRKLTHVSNLSETSVFQPACERGDRTRWFLKVQDGCDYFCTYCTIPYARGRSRSPEIESLVAQAREVALRGGKEIVLTGVNIGDFGKGTQFNFFDLIRALDTVEGIERYRISSIEPNLLSEEIVSWVASKSRAFMPHFHIPLQAGSDHVLQKMNRRYDTSLFRERISLIRRLVPDAFIGVDVIAGARGETPEHWQEGIEFIRSLDVDKLHVFPYSERPGTAALALGDSVPIEERHRRVGELTQLSDRKLMQFLRNSIGSRHKVLWEMPRPGMEMHGFTENYIRVTAPFREDCIGKVTDVTISDFNPRQDATMSATL